MWRPKVPISVAVGEPIPPTLPAARAHQVAAFAHAASAGTGARRATAHIRRASSGFRTGSAAARRRWQRLRGWMPKKSAEQAARRAASQRIRRQLAAAVRTHGVAAWRNQSFDAGDRRHVRRPDGRPENHLPRFGEHPNHRRRRYRDQPHQLCRLDAGAIAAYRRGRRLRFMIKQEMLDVQIVGFLMRDSSMIPSTAAQAQAPTRLRSNDLRDGELVGRVSRGHDQPQLSSSRSSRPAPCGWPARRAYR